MKQRGVVIVPSARTGVWDPDLDPVFLRTCALYFDAIDLPASRMVEDRYDRHPAVQSLVQAGILTRTRGYYIESREGQPILRMPVENPARFWGMAQLYVYRKKRAVGEDWVLGQPSLTLSLPSTDEHRLWFVETNAEGTGGRGQTWPSRNPETVGTEIGPILEVEISDALQVVAEDAPIDELLDFKQRRRDELLRWRRVQDEFYEVLRTAPDEIRAQTQIYECVELALLDLNRVQEESKLFRRLRNGIKSVFSLDGSKAIAAIAVLTTQHLDLKTLQAVAGSVVAGLHISVHSDELKPKTIPTNLQPFAYLYHAKRKFGE